MKTAILIILSVPLYAALPTGPTLQWDVRTAGNDTNGGGFIGGLGGTDFSQQNGPQQAYTDLLIGTPNTTITSAAHPFGSTAPGNLIHIATSTGFTAGWYEITGVVGVVATLDRSPGATGGTNGGANLGGALLTLSTANTNLSRGNVVHVKAGTYTHTLTLSVQKESVWIGYQTNHNDNGTKPLITTATNSIVLITADCSVNSPLTTSFENFSFSSTAATPAAGLAGAGASCVFVSLTNCAFVGGFTTGIAGLFFHL